jgi:hypothetical protein
MSGLGSKWKYWNGRSFARASKMPPKECKTCGSGGPEFRQGAPWVRLQDNKGMILPSEKWEYYCNECRALQVLAGEDWEVYNLEDF